MVGWWLGWSVVVLNIALVVVVGVLLLSWAASVGCSVGWLGAAASAAALEIPRHARPRAAVNSLQL